MRHLLFVLVPFLAIQVAPPAPQTAPAVALPTKRQPATWAEVARVVDGDTIHVNLGGKVEKLRLLCVDTEEKIGSGAGSATKPQTVFGEECALWAQQYFECLGEKDAVTGATKPVKVGLLFPPGRENHRDPFGRLLCHVILPDGTDFNVLLVKLGKSPYFTKYGYSEVCHDEMAAAQKTARAQKIGIWNPETNKAATPGTPSAVRPYDRLLPWWEMRAKAVAAFQARKAKDPQSIFEAESSATLCEAVKASETGQPTLVFGEIDRLYDEGDGSRTVLFRAAVRDEVLRVRIPKEHVAALAAAKLDQRGEEFQQNYVTYRGRIERSGKGFTSTCTEASAWSDGARP